ncbi:MAG TPA: DUF6457 domain-containing protein [Candidatus Dormibacteraeota bacterium]|nr:DUF6457 domain-containing protein [Candidatus Dormibacteraeota bacterium]
MNKFFDDLGKRWVSAAQRDGSTIDAPALDSEVALELLELARVAAHTQERRFAPLSCYLAGVAAERVRTAKPQTDSTAIAALIRDVRQELETSYPAPSER